MRIAVMVATPAVVSARAPGSADVFLAVCPAQAQHMKLNLPP